MYTSTMLSTREPNYESDGSMPIGYLHELFDELVAVCYPDIEDPRAYCLLIRPPYSEQYGDYAFHGVLDLLEKSREEYPKRSAREIAQNIKTTFESEYKERFIMIQTLSLHDPGILTFSIEGSWLAKSINGMLESGIDTWSPRIYDPKTEGRAVFVFPSQYTGSDMIRAGYIRDALENLYLFSGARVGRGHSDDEAMQMTQNCFTEIHGEIVSNSHKTLNGPNVDAVFTDLATLWYGVNTQKAHTLVYMTPHRIRGYIENLHKAAANEEGWLPSNLEKLCTLTCCGFRTFSGEQQELAYLWEKLNDESPAILETIATLGYNSSEFFECAFRFTCLRSHRLAECIFRFRYEDIDIVGEEGNTFVSLLRTQSLVLSLIKDSPGGNFNLHELAWRQRELGLHIVKFTEVIDYVCRNFVPHLLCEYLLELSGLCWCCYREVWRGENMMGENMLGLCKATEVVMSKCMQLLGIHPKLSGTWTDEFESLLSRPLFSGSLLDPDYRIPSDESRIKHPNSRFEIISMYVSLPVSEFEKGYIWGNVTVKDTCRLANSSGWVSIDEDDDCHVAYYAREWYETDANNEAHMEIMFNGSFIPLRNTSCIHSIPVSSSVEFEWLIKATSEEKDETYLVSHSSCVVELERFWNDGDLKAKCGNIKSEYGDRSFKLDYVVIKDAVDTRMEVCFKPKRAVRLSGSITASYVNDVLENGDFLGQYTAHVFRADPRTEYTIDVSHLLPLHKSAMAVPVDSFFELQVDLLDVDDTEQSVLEKTRIYANRSPGSYKEWKFGCDLGFFELRVRYGSYQRFSDIQSGVSSRRYPDSDEE